MNNQLANSDIGLASRKIGFALVTEIAGKDWRDRSVYSLQEAFAEFGEAIVNQIIQELKNDGSQTTSEASANTTR